MNCKKAEKYLVEYLYQELSPRKTVEIEKHVKVCDRCAQTLENWRAIHRGFQRSSEEKQPSPYLKQKILLAAKDELARPATFSERFLSFAKLASVPVAIFVIALILYIPWQKKNQDQAPVIGQVQQEERQRGYSGDSEADKDVQPTPSQRMKDQRKAAIPPAADRLTKKLDSSSPQNELKAKESREQTFRDEEAGERFAEMEGASGRKDDLANKLEQPTEEAAAPTLADAQPQSPSAPPAAKAAPEAGQSKSETVSLTKQTSGDAFRQSQMLFARNDLKSGYVQAQQAIEQDSTRELAGQFHQSGVQYQQRREYDKAILQFRLVTNNYPEYPQVEDVLMRLADSYAEIGQFENARRVYQQLLSSSQRPVAAEKLQDLRKKEDAQEKLRSLGYTDQN